MRKKVEQWYWMEGTRQMGPETREAMDAAFAAGRITKFNGVWTEGMPQNGVPYGSLANFEVVFEPAVEDFLGKRSQKFTTVFSGMNNGGKSLLLQRMYLELGDSAYLIGFNRIYHFDRLNTQERQQFTFHSEFYRHFYTAQQNLEQNQFELQQILVSMSNDQRAQLFTLCEEMLGNTFSIKSKQGDNEFSPKYVDMDGQNLVYGSTGTRLLMTILGICLKDEFDTLLIDEPELGLSPRIQSTLAHYLYDSQKRQEKFPHLKHLYVATHSHLFLDKSNVSNNYVVSKAGPVVSITEITSISDFHHLQYNLLGNELEALFMPSAIIFVEGETDHKYLSRLVEFLMPNKKINSCCGWKVSGRRGNTREIAYS